MISVGFSTLILFTSLETRQDSHGTYPCLGLYPRLRALDLAFSARDSANEPANWDGWGKRERGQQMMDTGSRSVVASGSTIEEWKVGMGRMKELE